MSEIIAKCGIVCSECGAYLATIQNSDELREETAKKWSAMFKVDIDPKTINCLGCQETDASKLISHCSSCGIRVCAIEKGYATCAECSDFGCEKLAMIWNHNDKARKKLEELRG